MNVQAPVFRRIQNGLGQDQPIGRHHRYIKIKIGKGLLFLGRFQRHRMADLDPLLGGPGMHRAWRFLVPAPRRTRRL